MKTRLPLVFYAVLVLTGGLLSWWLAPWLLGLAAPATVGICLGAIFGALYVGELKQESVGQLYQALAASALKSAEQAAFNDAALRKIRRIRKHFLFSNLLKLLGVLAALYLANEKQVPPPLGTLAVARCAVFMLALSMLYFTRMWFEVSAAEQLLMRVKLAAMLKARKDTFLKDSSGAEAHDFTADAAAQSFGKPAEEEALVGLK